MGLPLKKKMPDSATITNIKENLKSLKLVQPEMNAQMKTASPEEKEKFKVNNEADEPWKKESASDFLYGRKGPWPQPSPDHPLGQAPAVLHIFPPENREFMRKIGMRYVWQALIYTPQAFVKGLIQPGLETVSDKEFIEILSKTIIAKLIKDQFDETDNELFSSYMEEKEQYCIVDMDAVKGVETFEGQYVSASKTLLRHKGNFEYEPVAISIYATKETFVPGDGDSWKLAKYYALQGAALITTLLEHPLIHFPYDAINAITKTAVPKAHVLFRLIFPHTFLTLPLENAVLEGSNSIISDRTYLPYTLYPGPGPKLKKVLSKGYMGIKNNASYPKFKYPMAPRKALSTYDVYLSKYFDEVYLFVEKILSNLDRNDHYVKLWAKYISQHINGFPNEKEISEGDNLVRSVAIYIWTVSINHSVDHYNYGQLNLRQVPMRLRQPPPAKNTKLWPLRKLNNWVDYGKYHLANIMFYKSLTVASLMTCSYDFDDKENVLLEEFRSRLETLDQKLTDEKMNYMPLDKIGVSIQF